MIEARKLANVGIKSRMRQFLLLIAAILVGVIISSAAHADGFHRASKRHFKQKYKTQLRLAGKECEILSEKRAERPKVKAVAFNKPKRKSKAEVDEPIRKSEQTAGSPQNKHLGS